MIRFALALAMASVSANAPAQPLTVHTGENWLFSIDQGEPTHARKVEPSASPARGELMVAVRSLFGTMMTITNNSATAYTYQAQLVAADGKSASGRTCTLPAGNKPTLESWPQKAVAVRIGNFHAAGAEGRC